MKKISNSIKMIICCTACITIMTACSPNEKDQAYGLLNEAREDMRNDKYQKAHELIDSMRKTYPKETECRKEALLFVDSLELNEARYEYKKADSIRTFKRLDLDEKKKEFVLEKDGKYQSMGYYVVPSQAGSKTKFKLFAEVGEDGTMQIVTIDKNRKYKYTTVSLSEDRGSMALLPANATANDALIVEQCYQLAKLFADVKLVEEKLEKLAQKIKFYEMKIAKRK